jgi:hypothetical protein
MPGPMLDRCSEMRLRCRGFYKSRSSQLRAISTKKVYLRVNSPIASSSVRKPVLLTVIRSCISEFIEDESALPRMFIGSSLSSYFRWLCQCGKYGLRSSAKPANSADLLGRNVAALVTAFQPVFLKHIK